VLNWLLPFWIGSMNAMEVSRTVLTRMMAVARKTTRMAMAIPSKILDSFISSPCPLEF
jgi:hypothetical protein